MVTSDWNWSKPTAEIFIIPLLLRSSINTLIASRLTLELFVGIIGIVKSITNILSPVSLYLSMCPMEIQVRSVANDWSTATTLGRYGL